MRIITILFSILLASVIHAQQQPLNTQFMYNKMGLNPAYAGSSEFTCVTAFYRNQWLGLDGSPSFESISVNAPLKDQRLGVGLNLSNYSIGVSNMLTIDGIYAYKVPMGPGVFSMGLQVSYRNYSVDFTDDRIITTDNIITDPVIQETKQSKNIYNVGTGIYYSTYDYYIGLSVPRLMSVNIDFDDLGDNASEVQHVYLMGGGSIQLNDQMRLTPQVLFRWVENVPLDFDLNMSLTIEDKYTGGLSYRAGGDKNSAGESFDFLFAIQALPPLTLGMSYDISLSELRKYQSGSIELMVHYCFGASGDPSKFVNPRFY